VKRLWNWLRGKVSGYYEAARQNFWGERTWLQGAVQDARFDATEADRTEILRKARFFECNDAVVNRLVDLFEQFVAGPQGLQVIPNTADEKWNRAARVSWLKWCKYPDLVSKQSFSAIQGILARRWFVDGEIFIHKTESPNSFKPRIRLYESHRCKTPKDRSKEEGKTVIDGVQIDDVGQKVGYWIQKDQKSDLESNFDLIPAEEIVHLFEPERPGQYRGLSFLYPVVNDIHDLNDITMYEKRAAKDASEITNVIKNAAGEVDPNTLRRQRMSSNSQDASGNAVTKRDDQYYKTTLAGRTLVLKTNEDIAQFQSNRPSVAQQSLWDYLLSRICAGVGISKLLVLPYSMQGTVTRSDLDVATLFFRSRSSTLAAAVIDIYEWVMGFSKDYDKELRSVGQAPTNWYEARIRPPRAPNVDTGRNSASMINEYQAGLRTAQDIFAENGEDWREQLRQRAEEAAYVLDLLNEFDGITKEDICNPTGMKPMPPQSDTPKEENAEAV
jgi:capsid protein